jgi:hypothetical protein
MGMSTEDSPAQLRGLPIWSAGDVQAVAVRHTAELTKRAGGDHETVVKLGLEILLDHGVISEVDLELLRELVEVVEGSREKPDVPQVTAIHDRLILRQDSTGLAIAIADIAKKVAEKKENDDSGFFKKIIGRAVEGAVAGMYVGEGAGFPEVGAVAGATAAAAVAENLTGIPD